MLCMKMCRFTSYVLIIFIRYTSQVGTRSVSESPAGSSPLGSSGFDGDASTSGFRRTLTGIKLQESQEKEAESCNPAPFSDLYAQIDADLHFWKTTGITQSLMDQSIAALGSMMTRKGVAISFEAGVAYIIRWDGMESF